MDSTPHAFISGSDTKWHLIDIIDDCSRLVTYARLYERELFQSHHDALSRAFLAHGLPLALDVDYHSLFYTRDPDSLTQLAAALHFYGVGLLYAPRRRPRVKSNVCITTGSSACPRSLPPKSSVTSTPPMTCWSNCANTTTAKSCTAS